MSRVSRVLVALTATLGLAAAPATASPDSHDHGDFWREVVHPHQDEIAQIKGQVREVLNTLPNDWNVDHRSGMLHDAQRAIRYARRLDPSDLELAYFQGALADESGQTLEAQGLLTEYATHADKDGFRFDAQLRLGKIALRQGRPELAILPLRQALADRSDRRSTVPAMVYLAAALDGAGRTSEAIDLLAGPVASASGAWEAEDAALFLALVTLYDRDEQISLAFELVADAQNVLGPQFAERMEPALAVAPPVPASAIHYTRAFLYETSSFLPEARAEWLSYVRLTPVGHDRDRALAHIAAIDQLLDSRRPTAARRGGHK